MPSSGFEYDLSRLRRFVDSIPRKVREVERRVGKAAVDYAVEHGSYHDVTGRLRASNRFEADSDGLKLYNTAPYAEDIEASGKEVLSGAALFAERMLREECDDN